MLEVVLKLEMEKNPASPARMKKEMNGLSK